MSRKQNHVIVPPCFTLADLERPRATEKLYRVTARQARAFAQAGIIRQFGAGERLWQFTGESSASVLASETGEGLLLREIPRSLRDVMRSAMTRRAIRAES